ncbi:MAG: MaoC family dehydratase N-terminal domain-containing protein [Actinomycetota bacterium]|jgi:acyl dehydratase
MAMNKALIGKTYPETRVYEVGREKIREFAIAVGEDNPICHDEAAAKAAGHPDLVAPPTFAVVMGTLYAAPAIGDPDLGINYAMIVHGEQEFELARPIYAGDRIVIRPRIADIAVKGRNELITVEGEMVSEQGERIGVAKMTLVSRGTAEEGA